MLFSELEKIPDFPCLSCPFIRKIEKDGVKIPLCSVYSHQESVGLESCQLVYDYIQKNGSKPIEKKEILTF